MFSKSLYKQSWKANGLLWVATTLVATFVLVIIMGLLGGEGIGTLTTTFTETIIEEQFTSNYQNTSINYYILTNDSLEEFDSKYVEGYLIELNQNPMPTPEEMVTMGERAYVYALDAMQVRLNSDMEVLVPEITELQRNEYLGVVMFSLNPGAQFNEMYESFEVGSTPLDYDVQTLTMKILTPGENIQAYLTSDERSDYRFNRSKYGNAIFLAGTLNTDEALEEIKEVVETYGVSFERYLDFGFDYEGLKYLANSAILTFEARVDYEISQNPELSKLEVINNLKADMTASFLTSLPENISEMLAGYGEQDMYTQVLSSVFYKIVGVLISVIYIILASINLISGQVDSGSMAYVLATGTKRNHVSFTQSIFLISSTFFMHLFITLVSVLMFYVAKPTGTEMTIWKLLMFGLGSFLLSFAFSGLNFLTSAIFNRSSRAMGIGGGISILMIIFTILGMFGSYNMPEMMRISALNFFNYFSIVTLFSEIDIIANSVNLIWKFGSLILIGITTFIVGAKVFEKKDLPL